MPFIEPLVEPLIELLSDRQYRLLLARSRDVLVEGVARGRRPPTPPLGEDPALAASVACFVTLTRGGALRGCIGTLKARRPLLEAVGHFAYSAGFEDPRFGPLTADELAWIRIEISLLSPLERLVADSEEALLEVLEPGVDGLWLDAGGRCATFLPQVWAQLPQPRQFVAQLKRKAGLAVGHWPREACWYRYRVSAFAEPDPTAPTTT